MKFFRKRLTIAITTLFVVSFIIYLSVFSLLYISYARPDIPFVRNIMYSRILYKASDILINSGVGNLYFFNSGVLFNQKPDFVLKFSNNDLMHKDSLLKEMKSGQLSLLEDWRKNWRKFEIVNKGEEINAKYKYHGSNSSPYIDGYESFTIKSDFPINGYKNFKLINGREMNYLNVFFNLIGHKFNLITEDPGSIVATNSMGRVQDFFQYQLFDEDYLKVKYGMEESLIIRRNTFWENNNNPKWHSSNLDNVTYNIDLNSISKEKFALWETLLVSPSEKNYDAEYLGRFLALLQLFNHPHQITGNNDKWVIDNGKVYPVYRNEAHIEPIFLDEINTNSLFDKYWYSYSLEPYKSALANNNVLIERNRTFKKLHESKVEITSLLDSVFNKHRHTHRRYNKKYLKLNYEFKYKKRVLEENLNIIDNYLNSGHSLILFDGEKIKVSSTRKNPLKVELNDKVFTFLPKEYAYNKNDMTIRDSFNELIIENIDVIDSLKIHDMILNKTLEIEKDYSILRVN